MSENNNYCHPFAYEKIIFNDPATIVIWTDGTKTIVKCSEEDGFDPEKAVALCFMKKALGNDSKLFHRVLRREVNNYISDLDGFDIFINFIKGLKESIKDLTMKDVVSNDKIKNP